MTRSGVDHGRERLRNGGGHAFQERRPRKREGRGRRDRSGDTDATENYGSRDGESDSEAGGKLAPGWGVGRGDSDCPGEVAVWPEGRWRGSSEVTYHAGARQVLGKREVHTTRAHGRCLVNGSCSLIVLVTRTWHLA